MEDGINVNAESSGPGAAAVNNFFRETSRWVIGAFGMIVALALGIATMAQHDLSVFQASNEAVLASLSKAMADNARDAAYARAKAEFVSEKAREAQQEADLAKYYTIDMETYLYKQGLTPPADPWRRKPKGKHK